MTEAPGALAAVLGGGPLSCVADAADRGPGGSAGGGPRKPLEPDRLKRRPNKSSIIHLMRITVLGVVLRTGFLAGPLPGWRASRLAHPLSDASDIWRRHLGPSAARSAGRLRRRGRRHSLSWLPWAAGAWALADACMLPDGRETWIGDGSRHPVGRDRQQPVGIKPAAAHAAAQAHPSPRPIRYPVPSSNPVRRFNPRRLRRGVRRRVRRWPDRLRLRCR